jgi:serine/threonine protein phosphatase PrpC
MPQARPSPVLGQAVPEFATAVSQQETHALKSLSGVSPKDIEAYQEAVVRFATSGPQDSGIMSRLKSLVAPPAPRSPEAQRAITERSAAAQEQIRGIGQDLTALYADGRISEGEVKAISVLGRRTDALLKTRDEGALKMLPPDVRKRLEQNLFGPLQQLRDAAGAHSDAIMSEVAARDLEPLKARLQNPAPRWVPVDLGALAKANQDTASFARYRPGDFVLVPRTDGHTSLGVVQHSRADGLQVGFIDEQTGKMSVRNMSDAEVRVANPFKHGDVVRWGQHELFVSRGSDGRLGAQFKEASGHWASVSFEELQGIQRGVAEQIHLTPTHPGQKVITTGTVLGGAEAREAREPHRLEGRTATGGLVSFRGPNEAEHGVSYADYNEDAALLGAMIGRDGKEVVVASACDQAGGMGKAAETGFSSRVAAESVAAALAEIAANPKCDPGKVLIEHAERAHKTIVADNVANGRMGEGYDDAPVMTTYAAVALRDGRAYGVNCGDSKIWHFAKDGTLKGMTEPDNTCDEMYRITGDPNNPVALKMANGLTSGLGVPRDEQIKVQTVEFQNVQPGDFFLVASDSLCDANLKAQQRDILHSIPPKPWPELHSEKTTKELCEVLMHAPNAVAATEAVRDYMLKKAASGEGKPDNTTVVVLQVR